MAKLELTPAEEKIILDLRANARIRFLESPPLHQARVTIMTLIDWIVRMAESGDAGNWDAEKMEEIIEARRVLGIVTMAEDDLPENLNRG